MFCWKEHDLFTNDAERGPSLQEIEGVPMSVQQAYAEMIGKEDLTPERYQVRFSLRSIIQKEPLNSPGQVYAYLKRLGYVVTRVKQPTSSYPVPPPYPQPVHAVRQKSFLQMVFSPIRFILTRITTLFAPARIWWKPLRISPLLGINVDYRQFTISSGCAALTVP